MFELVYCNVIVWHVSHGDSLNLSNLEGCIKFAIPFSQWGKEEIKRNNNKLNSLNKNKRHLCDKVANMPDSDSIVRKSELQSLYYLHFAGARGVMVIVVGNGHGDTSSNPGRDWLHFT